MQTGEEIEETLRGGEMKTSYRVCRGNKKTRKNVEKQEGWRSEKKRSILLTSLRRIRVAYRKKHSGEKRTKKMKEEEK